MKKSVRSILHVSFWILIPLTVAFYDWAGQADDFFGIARHSKNFFEILLRNFESLFVRPDVGSDLMSPTNILGILVNVIGEVVYPLVIFYLFYGYFAPAILKRKSNWKYLAPGLFIAVVPFGLTGILSTFIFTVDLGFYSFLSLCYVFTLFFAVSGFFFFLLEHWVETEKLARKNLESELALLKNQVNPHFLFNTLNNIDSLIKNNPDKASQTLIRLSDMLRYMIYETDQPKVSLADEIRYLESYVDLQKLQFSNRDLVSFSVHGNPEGIRIAPMLFIPFVENAFKHCTDKSKPAAIRLDFEIKGNKVEFTAENSANPARSINKDEAGGVGLSLVSRRLELIYPGRHTLVFGSHDNVFTLSLSVNTDEH